LEAKAGRGILVDVVGTSGRPRGASEPDLPWSLPAASWELAVPGWAAWGWGCAWAARVPGAATASATPYNCSNSERGDVATCLVARGLCVGGECLDVGRYVGGKRLRWEGDGEGEGEDEGEGEGALCYVMLCYGTCVAAAEASDSEQEQQDMNSKTLSIRPKRRRTPTRTRTRTRTRTAE
jgi:hypothetical protein